jgi:uncharacterized protein (TIGR02001 family)
VASPDVGAIQYLFPETSEDATTVVDNTDFLELYAGVALAGLSARAYVTNDYFNTDEDAIYVTAASKYDIKDDLAVTAQAGYSDGDGVGVFIGDSYADYNSLSLSKSLQSGFGASIAIVNTTLDESETPLLVDDDSPKCVISLTENFDL